MHRNFRNKIYLYEIQNCLFDCAACFDELLCDTLWLLNNITNVNVFKKAEQKKKKKVSSKGGIILFSPILLPLLH